ncbi:MAG: D-alanyl-D-alanine carboxypeptidase [Bacteroidetes bacterium]|nr:D-alanyl-D-alanine carboxypeptidase [Bacteroidota bacterium]
MRIFLLTLVVFAGCSPALRVKKEIQISERQLKNNVGFYLLDFSNHKVLVDYHGAHYYLPASNDKVLTLYTSLKTLGDSVSSLKYYQAGDSLIFQGMGDPSFLYSNTFNNGRVYTFLRNYSSRLFFSSSNFQAERLGAGWAWDDYNDYYSAERSSFPLYGNLIHIVKNSTGNFTSIPSRFSADFSLSSETHVNEEIIRDVDSNHLVYFNGKRKSDEFYIPFRTASDLTADLLSDTLHRTVEEVNKPFPAKASILKSIPSDSLYKVMMQESDNFIAEQLLLQCAATVSDTLKPEIAIRYSLKNILADLPDTPRWVDGSGLSRYNLITPRTMVALWEKIYRTVPQDRLFPLLVTNGKAGTLKNWFKGYESFLFGKTGSFSNNQSLSGFLITRKKKLFIFSFMSNNFVAPGREVRAIMEKIIKEIHDNY